MERDSNVHDSIHGVQQQSHDETRQPLLPKHQKPDASEPNANPHDSVTRRNVLILVGILSILFETGNAIRVAPLIAVYETKLCSQLHPQINNHDNEPCNKLPGVEQSLALLLGVSQFVECVPMLLLSARYGSLADRYGRRPILILGYLGLILSAAWMTLVAAVAPGLPLQLVWLGPIFTILGGGQSVPISILVASAADVVPPSQKVTAFAWIHAAALVAVMIGSLISFVAMPRIGNYPPLFIGLSLMCSCLILGCLLPNTQPSGKSQIEIAAGNPASADTSSLPASQDSDNTTDSTIIDSAFVPACRTFRDVWQVSGAPPILLAGFLSMLGLQVQILILQYMPSRFGVSIAEANLFNILGSGINLIVLFVVLPLFSVLLLKRYHTVLRRDIVLARVSSIIFIVGALILGLARTLSTATIGFSIFSLGIGLSSLLRSIFVELFAAQDAAFAITLISTLKGIGGSLSGPVYSGAFAASLNGGETLRGLPFFVSVVCFITVLCSLYWGILRKVH